MRRLLGRLGTVPCYVSGAGSRLQALAGVVWALSAEPVAPGNPRQMISGGAPPPQPDVRQLPRVLLFALNGFLALVALAVLFGVWFGRTGGT